MKISSIILSVVRSSIVNTDPLILLHAPHFPSQTNDYVQECVRTGWVSSAGAFVNQFEKMLADFTGCKRAVATVNGTAALEMCYRIAGIQPGDEVICPSLTFVATPNAISHCGATPHFVDVDERTLGVCPTRLKEHLAKIGSLGADGLLRNRHTGRRISAVSPMHCFGHPCRIDEIASICNEFGLALVEDAAESLGSFYQNKHTGRFGKLAAVSFNGNKIITTGGGGAILTDDDKLADLAKHLTTTAKIPHAWEFHHDQIGWNFRMPNINAALGVAQLEVLPQLLEAKRALAMRYAEAFESVEGVEFITEPEGCRSNYWLNAIRVKNASLESRNEILQSLNDAGYQSRPIWEPMHHLPMYASCPRADLTNTEILKNEIINIPSSAQLSPIPLPN